MVSFEANRGRDIDLVLRFTLALDQLPLATGEDGAESPGPPTAGFSAPAFSTTPPASQPGCFRVAVGQFILDRGGNPGDDTSGSFDVSFVTDGSYGSGRGVSGTFRAVALDGGYGDWDSLDVSACGSRRCTGGIDEIRQRFRFDGCVDSSPQRSIYSTSTHASSNCAPRRGAPDHARGTGCTAAVGRGGDHHQEILRQSSSRNPRRPSSKTQHLQEQQGQEQQRGRARGALQQVFHPDQEFSGKGRLRPGGPHHLHLLPPLRPLPPPLAHRRPSAAPPASTSTTA